MATVYWTGSAPSIAQVETFTFVYGSGSAPTFSITIGGVTISVAGVTNSNASAAAMFALLNASRAPMFLEISWTYTAATNVITATAKTAGYPFITSKNITGGTAASFTKATVQVNVGPNDLSSLANYSGGALPIVNVDTFIIPAGVPSPLYGVNGVFGFNGLDMFVPAGFTGTIGLPTWNNSNGGYAEYRPTLITLGFTGVVHIGYGPGTGSPRMRFSGSGGLVTVFVQNTANPADVANGALFFDNTTGTTFQILKGNVGFGPAIVTATLDIGYTNNVNSDVIVVADIAATFESLVMTGGNVTIAAYNPGTIIQQGGVLTIIGSDYLSSLTLGSTQNTKVVTNLENTGGIKADTFINGPNSYVDFSGEMTDKVMLKVDGTSPLIIQRSPGSTINDPQGVTIAPWKMQFINCGPEDCTTILSQNRTLEVIV